MKTAKLLFAFVCIFLCGFAQAQNNFGINTTTPDASAALDITSTSQGILVPRMTTAARVGITNPAKGLMVYDSTLKAFYFHDGAAWAMLGGGSTSVYPNVEVNDYVTTQQAITVYDAPTAAPYSQLINFSGVNHTNATLTGGNTWNGSRFTAGTAGWYEIQVQMNTGSAGNNLPANAGFRYLLDKSDAIGTNTRLGAYAYSSYDFDGNSSGTVGLRTSNSLHAIIYLAANQYINLKGWSMAAGANAYNTTDGSSNITIVRLK